MSILLCMGTRPEIIKMAPVYRAMLESGLQAEVLHTGQHIELAEPLYRFFDMMPRYNLKLIREGGDLGALYAALSGELAKAIRQINPRVVLVHGDTLSALTAATLSYLHGAKVCHVEAGLRTYDDLNPFPEEKSREVIARFAVKHFAPTQLASENLLREGVPTERIVVTGNTVVDAAKLAEHFLASDDRADGVSAKLASFARANAAKRLVLVTAHRRENWGQGLVDVAAAVGELVQRYSDIVVLWPLHANPAVGDVVRGAVSSLPREQQDKFMLTSPLSYPEMIYALKAAWMVLTDSGGIQEEAVTLGRPVIVLRECTERPEVVSLGVGVVSGTQPARILKEFSRIYEEPMLYENMTLNGRLNPFGDGLASVKIAREVASLISAG